MKGRGMKRDTELDMISVRQAIDVVTKMTEKHGKNAIFQLKTASKSFIGNAEELRGHIQKERIGIMDITFATVCQSIKSR